MIILLLLFLIFSPTASFAEKYVIEHPDCESGLCFADIDSGEDAAFFEYLNTSVYTDYPVYAVKDGDFPTDKKDRKYWKRIGKKIVIDTAKKQADLDAKAQKESERSAVLSKLKISKEEFKKIKDIE